MRRKILRAAGASIAWALVVCGLFALEVWLRRPPVTRGDPASIERHLVRELRDAVERKRLGSASLVLMHDGRIVAEHGFGIANVNTQTATRPDRTLYMVASVSKAVTAWGVMRLVQDGRLGLDEPVLRHLQRWRFPESAAFRERVTARHLLSHTAGLDDGLGYGGFLPGEAVQTLEESLSGARDSRGGRRAAIVTREPGIAMAYSGAGYTILQLLVEEITQQKFSDYMKHAVLRPLGMTTASFSWDDLASDQLATAYDSRLAPQPHRRHTALAAVSLYASARDVAQFMRAFVAPNPVLRPETLKQMLAPQPGTHGTWGLGHTLFADPVVGHDGGSVPAWGAMLRVNPRSGNGMVLLTSGGAGAVNQLGHDWVYWETGIMTTAARRQLLYGRVVPASVAFFIGALVINVFLWRR